MNVVEFSQYLIDRGLNVWIQMNRVNKMKFWVFDRQVSKRLTYLQETRSKVFTAMSCNEDISLF